MDKALANAIHFKRKIKQRLGWDLTEGMKRQITNSINDDTFIKKISKTRSLYCVYINGVNLMLIFDIKRRSLITAWPDKKLL